MTAVILTESTLISISGMFELASRPHVPVPAIAPRALVEPAATDVPNGSITGAVKVEAATPTATVLNEVSFETTI